MLGIAFSPLDVRAGFFTSFLGTNVLANDVEVPSSTYPLPLPNVSNETKSGSKDVLDSNIDVNIVSDSALMPATSSMGILAGSSNSEFFSDEISVYVVRKGDAISQIAEMFGVSTNTIRWANDLKKGDTIKEGDVLLILPVNGVKHIVQKGQTLKGIASKYKADIAYIAGFNGISEDAVLSVGDELIIPDAEMTEEVNSSTTKKSTTSKNSTSSSKVVSGYFINPVPGAVRTQGLHGKGAVDLAAPIGTPIYASAPGKVLLARYGWNGAYGNMILIQHPNGTQTLYSHLSSISTKTGATVGRGELIGKVGNTGRVRAAPGGNGAHLHFEVHGAKNPGVDNSWAK